MTIKYLKSKIFTLTIIVVASVLMILSYQHLNIGFLMIAKGDEYAFHGSLLKMYEGITSLDITKTFSFSFFNYGFGFFLINLLVTFGFIATDNTEMAIYLPRMVTSFFALLSLWYLYKIARIYVKESTALLFAVFVLTMPAFWRNAMWFHPDWMMTAFLIMSLYYFALDQNRLGKNFWFAVLAFSFALSSKFQAITFYPALFFYVFFNEIAKRDFSDIKAHLITFAKAVVSSLVIFVFTNPYLMHPVGFRAFWHRFQENMRSNVTYHGMNVRLALMDKISNAIDFHYLAIFLFAGLMLLLIFYSIRYFYSKKPSIFHIVALYGVLNIAYLLLMVNKDWQHYYLAVIVISVLVFIELICPMKLKKQIVVLLVLVLANGLYHNNQFRSIAVERLHPERDTLLLTQKQVSKYLVKILDGHVSQNTHILMSPYTGFDFEKIGLRYQNIHIIYGPLAMSMVDSEAYLEKRDSEYRSPFRQKDFIILRKNDIYFEREKWSKRADKEGYAGALKIIKQLNNGSLGYYLFAENESAYIWKMGS